MPRERFLIIDGSSILYRAFYALPLLQNRRGEHTNAVYGFTNMLMGILDKTSPDFGAVVFDRAAPTFRHQLYDEYKAQREQSPSELNEQVLRVKEILDAFKIPVFELDGYEADDIIGALAEKACDRGLESLLFTGDTDLFQLITESTKVIIVRRGISDIHEYDLDRLRERYNLSPGQMIDFKALKGDPSDNIPGVPGIGEKTALKLLHEYGNLDRILASAGELKGRIKENLLLYREKALLSRKLVTIVCHIDELDFTWDQCRLETPHYGLLGKIFGELEFRSLISKLPSQPSSRNLTLMDAAASPDLIPVKTLKQLREIKEELNNFTIAVAVTVSDKYPRWENAPEALAFAFNDSTGYYLDPSLINNGLWKPFLAELFNAENGIKILGHNTKLLVNLLSDAGISSPSPAFDSMLAGYLLDPGRPDLSMRSLLKEYLGADPVNILSPRKGDNNPETISCALAEDVPLLFELKTLMEKKIEETDLKDLYHHMELPLSLILSRMELQGICVDRDRLCILSEEIKETISRLEGEIYTMAGEEFNLNSPRQLSRVLFEKLKMPVMKKTKTGYSTDVKVLEELALKYDIAAKILYFRQLVKLEGTYLSGLLPYVHKESGKIHTTFNQTVTTTGRLSSSDPNLQNIPVRMPEGHRIREAFIPSKEEHIFLAADYSQIELRILAHLSNDPTLVEAFCEDEDIHTRTAAEIFHVAAAEVTPEMRKRAKAVNFGIIYGISDYGLARDLGISRKEAGIYIDNYFLRYHGVRRYMEEIVGKARRQGYVTTLFNRRRYLPEINDTNFSKRSFAERTARNTPIQGSAADIIKLAMLQIHERLQEKDYSARLLLQVHDELILELPEEEKTGVTAIVKKQMENAVILNVPVRVDIHYGKNWFAME